MTWYWLTVMDSVKNLCVISGSCGAILVAIATGVWLMDEDLREQLTKRLVVSAWLVVLVLCLVALFVPSLSQSRQAWVMVEASKLGTAENAEAVIKRLDELAERLVGREETKP